MQKSLKHRLLILHLVLVNGLSRIGVNQGTLDLVERLIGVTLDGTLGIAEDEATSVTSVDTSLRWEEDIDLKR